MIFFFLLSCSNDREYRSIFEGPEYSDVFYPPEDSPLVEPIAFISNLHSGQIIPLDTKHETPFSDQIGAPFLRPRGVATGAARQLGPIHAFAPSADRINLFAIDYRHSQLIMAPYIEGMLPEPQVIIPTNTPPVFQDNDASNDDLIIESITLRTGKTTTEDWTLNFNDGIWRAEGSRSGIQESTGLTNYISDRGEIDLIINGSATDGDQILLRTDSGILEWDLDGVPLQIIPYGDDELLIHLWNNEKNQSSIVQFDAILMEEVDRWDGPIGVQLYDIVIDDNTLYAGAAKQNTIFVIDLDGNNLSDATFSEIDAPSPTQDLEIIEDVDYKHLVLAGAGNSSLYYYDLDSNEWLDLQPFSEDIGIPLYSPIIGISSSKERVPLQTVSPWGSEDTEKVLVITTFNGSILMADGRTGCMSTFKSGGYAGAVEDPTSNVIEFQDTGPTSDPSLLLNPASGSAISTAWCGGLMRTESWTVLYDAIDGNFVVEGSKSGEQENRAYLDERYISDHGAISFSIISGNYPPTDGDQYIFSTSSGFLKVSDVLTTTGGTEYLELPGPPTTFDYWAGPLGGGWNEYSQRSFALIPVTNSNIVLRVRLDNYSVEAVWN